MNVDDKNVLPSTNLTLGLGYSNRCIQRILCRDQGAGVGANAASRLDMTFLATNTLSELVWSPKKGLCLKYADCRFLNQEQSLLYALEPIDMASGSSSDKPVNEEMFMASLAACKLESEVAGEGNSSMFPSTDSGVIPLGETGTSDQVEEMENKVDLNILKKEDPGSDEGEDEINLNTAQKSPTCKEPIAVVEDIEEGTHALRLKNVVAPEKITTDECEANETKENIDEGRNGEMDTRKASIIPLDHMESSAENDLENLLCQNAYSVANEIVLMKPADVFDRNTQQDDGLRQAEKTLEVKTSSSSSKVQKGHINGKAIVIADDNGDGKMLNQDDHSSDTVESCNSTGQVSTGKRQWNFEQTLIVENKQFKRQMHESPGSSSRQDSSFMNWISNMTKGFSKLPEGEATCNENKDLVGSRNVGFHSIFRSIYSQKRKGQEALTLNDCETKVSKEVDLVNTIYDMNATPIACRMASERLSSSISGNQLGPAVNSMDLAVIKQSNSKSTENRYSNNVATKDKDETSSNSSHGKCNTDLVEKIDSEMAYKEKTAHDSGFITDPFSSLWISRFTKKASPSHWKRSTGEHLDNFSDDVLKPKPQLLNLIGSSNENEKNEVGIKCTEAEASFFSFDKIKVQDNATSSYKLNHVSDSSRYNSPEAMASVFARRLDALKHIEPLNDPDKADYLAVTCFFCGKKGHHLQECPETTDTELEDLVRNFDLYNGVKDLSCVCIRCFQLSHWAVSCPSVCKRLRNRPESDTSVANQCDDDRKQEGTAAHALNACDYHDSEMETNFPFNWQSNEASTSQKMALDMKLLGKEIASSSGENRLKENQTTHISGQISDVPNGVFDAIRSLRLTRTDVLKWLNSGSPVSNLDGYFLRLRLGKWEEGLGGTGYHAAYITGVHIESSGEKSKGSIPVNVGGMKCLVKSQYVSNQDFLEDELRAWWSATLREGDNIPTEEELRLKVQEKKRLGL